LLKHALPSVLQVPGTAGHSPALVQGRLVSLHRPSGAQSPLTAHDEPVAEQCPAVFGHCASFVHSPPDTVQEPLFGHSPALVHAPLVTLQWPPRVGQSATDWQTLCAALHCPSDAQSPDTRQAVPDTWHVPCNGAQSPATLQALWLTLH
jgi:hypothetical protein